MFTHIHCSSRFDREVDSLDFELMDWLDQASLVTMTDCFDVRDGLANNVWGHHSQSYSKTKLAGLIVWNMDQFKAASTGTIILSVGTMSTWLPVYFTWAQLRHVSNQDLLVMVTAMPAFIEGQVLAAVRWDQRKQAYAYRLGQISTMLRQLNRTFHPDAILLAGDWNLNLKDDWVRDQLYDSIGLSPAWSVFPTTGTGIPGHGGVPEGLPGLSVGERIIVSSFIGGLTTPGPVLMPSPVGTHRPYVETFEYAQSTEPYLAEGDTHPGEPWWGFGDKFEDEMYDLISPESI